MKRAFVPLTIAALLFLSACHLARGGTPEVVISGDTAADQQTAVALAVQQTQVALTMQAPQPVIPTETPSVTLSPTSSVPMVTVSVETNCRTGPGAPYDILGGLPVGVPAEVIGRNAYGDTWIIKLPSNPSITCWLWGYYATVVGDTSGLTIYTPPPTPTPPPGFSVTYLGKMTCCDYIFRFELKNLGAVTWESVRIIITDSNTSTSVTYTSDKFKDFSGCVLTNTLLDLEPGEVGVVVNEAPADFNYNPTGHNFTATFKLCSLDGLGGTCVDKSITFTP